MPGARNLGIEATFDVASDEPDDELERLVLRLHQRPSVPGSEVAPPHVRDPVGIRVLESRLVSRSLRKSLEQRAETLGDPPQNRVRERNRPLRSRGAHELHRLVHGGVTRDAVHVAELVCAEAERRPHRSVELLDAAASERADRVVERPHALNGAERESPRERPVALVELRRSSSQSAVGIRLLLEDSPEDLERGGPGRTYLSPRSHAW